MKKVDPKLIVVLTVIMICSATVLTFLHRVTEPQIEAHAQRAKEEAIKQVLPGTAEFDEVTKGELTLYRGLDETGSVVGHALEKGKRGYQEDVVLMIGFDLEDQIIMGIEILDHAETPGLGARIEEEEFRGQFQNQPLTASFQINQDVDAISGATISSEAVVEIVKEAAVEIQEAQRGNE